MRCIVTAGPTYEPLDEVRRLTNLSTGRLGIELAATLTALGHQVILLVGAQATWPQARRAARVETFSTTEDLERRLAAQAGPHVDAVFHAAAVSDFAFGRVYARSQSGRLTRLRAGKFTTREGVLLAELVPTPKLISQLRHWFPNAVLTGWKYETDGTRAQVLERALRQITENRSDLCVANGPAYGKGFGLVSRDGSTCHSPSRPSLYKALVRQVERLRSSAGARLLKPLDK